MPHSVDTKNLHRTFFAREGIHKQINTELYRPGERTNTWVLIKSYIFWTSTDPPLSRAKTQEFMQMPLSNVWGNFRQELSKCVWGLLGSGWTCWKEVRYGTERTGHFFLDFLTFSPKSIMVKNLPPCYFVLCMTLTFLNRFIQGNIKNILSSTKVNIWADLTYI